MDERVPLTADVVETKEAVETPTEETVSMEEVASAEAPTPTEGQLSKGSGDFTPEERATIIAMAKEVGFAKVASEFGIKVRQISYWVQQEKKKASKPSKPSKRSTAKASTKGKDSKRTPGKGRPLVKEVEHIEDTPAMPAEPVKVIEPAGRKAERTVSAKPVGSVKPQERSEEKQSLIIENAILKERIASLNAEIEKLRAALTSLM